MHGKGMNFWGFYIYYIYKTLYYEKGLIDNGFDMRVAMEKMVS
jgi:hypothetical protein